MLSRHCRRRSNAAAYLYLVNLLCDVYRCDLRLFIRHKLDVVQAMPIKFVREIPRVRIRRKLTQKNFYAAQTVEKFFSYTGLFFFVHFRFVFSHFARCLLPSSILIVHCFTKYKYLFYTRNHLWPCVIPFNLNHTLACTTRETMSSVITSFKVSLTTQRDCIIRYHISQNISFQSNSNVYIEHLWLSITLLQLSQCLQHLSTT